MSDDSEYSLEDVGYSGLPGSSSECQQALMRLLQFGDRISRVRILSSSNNHCLLLTVNDNELIAVKSGFTSGYRGEGPRTFSYALQLLSFHGAQIEEYEVASDFIERLDNSSLTGSDIKYLNTARQIRPSRWRDYVLVEHFESSRNKTLWQEFPPLIPFALIDSRIIDLAISFWEAPDERLLTGYRRLEDIVRKRTGIDEHGAKLFSQAFNGPTAKLGWEVRDSSEQAGRASLFTGVFMAYRNPRAHREVQDNRNDQLDEFLLLNHLYRLENLSGEKNSESNSA